MTEEIDAILFDAGGTLFDMTPPREEVVSEVLARHGHRVDAASVARALARADGVFDREFAELDGKNEEAFWTRYDDFLLDELGFTGDKRKVSIDLNATFDEMIPKVSSWVDYPETKPVLDGLRRREFRLGVVSNATDLARRVLDSLGLTEYFDFILLSEEVGVRKPAPRIFHMAAGMADTRPSRCLFVGDKLAVDVMGARRVGMSAVLVDRNNAYPDAKCLRERDLSFFRKFV